MATTKALDRVARIVAGATRPFAPVAIAGLVAAGVILVALAPWLLPTDEGRSAWITLAVLGLAGPARLGWHRRRLRRGLGDPARAVREAGDVLRSVGDLPARLARVEAKGRRERRRGVIASLRELRALRVALSVTGLADRAHDLYGPLTPPALWLTGIAALAVAATVVAAPIIALLSLLVALLGW